MRRLTASFGLLVAVSWASAAAAFVVSQPPTRWPSGTFTMNADIVHPTLGRNSAAGPSWNAAFAEAAANWSTASPHVDLPVVQGVFADPCNMGDGIHGVGFSVKNCGPDFGEMTLAVAHRQFSSGGLVVDGNIVFKTAADWNVYSGALTSDDDFRRVADHEIGHLWGLDHENGVPAIMAPFVDDNEGPQADDLAGIAAIYDITCPQIRNTGSGTVLDTLAVTDCFDTEIGLAPPTLVPPIGVGLPEVNSFVQLHRLSMPSAGSIRLELTTATNLDFNPIIALYDEGLTTQLAADWNGAGGSLAFVDQAVAAGTYMGVVRSIFEGSGGDYTLTVVPEPASALGGVAALAALAAVSRHRHRARG